MDLFLVRKEFESDGVWGELTADTGDFFAFTLEHSYNLAPKLAQGTYKCVRGKHTLWSSKEKIYKNFETFEITNVPDFMGFPVTGILFHAGNYNSDSQGCVLIGLGLGRMTDGGQMLTSSKQAMAQLMELQKDVDSFMLVITDIKQ